MLRQTTVLCLGPALSAALSLAVQPAWAEVPRVVVDTAPLHSLVAQVMAGVGTPDLILPPGTSPHDVQLRPSEAARLGDAQVVIWMGEGLTPWLADPVATLAADAATLDMLETGGWPRLPLRADADFAQGARGEGDDPAGAEGDQTGTGQADRAADPHAWLDPAVAGIWLGLIAETLATADPANAGAYRANATTAAEAMAALRGDLAAALAPVAGQPFIVPHDAYQYFEVAFGLTAIGAISLSDASDPGPARLAGLRDKVAAGDVGCILTDPQTPSDWTEVLRDGTPARTALVDPDATRFAPGPDLYPQMMRAMAAALVTCLTPPS